VSDEHPSIDSAINEAARALAETHGADYYRASGPRQAHWRREAKTVVGAWQEDRRRCAEENVPASAPSSLRTELAEAKATIARLTVERDTMRALIKQENGLMVNNLVADLVKRRNIAATAAAYVESCLCNGGTDVPQLNAAIDRAFLSLAAAVEEGNRT